MQRMNWGKTFVIGLGFFGVSVLWSLYNTYVPLLLDQRFGMDSVMVGFFMSLDNIAALFIQPPVGALSDRLRTPLGRRLPFILIGAPIAAIAFGLIPLQCPAAFCSLHGNHHPLNGFLAHAGRGPHARCNPLAVSLAGQWHH